MWRTSATAWAMPSPVLSRSRCAVGSPTRRRADSTCSRIPARVAPRPSCSSRLSRRRSTSRVVTRDSRLRWSCWWSWRAARAGAAWSATCCKDLGVALVEPAFTRPRGHPQPAHDLAAVAQVEGRGVLGTVLPALATARRSSWTSSSTSAPPSRSEETTRWQTTCGTFETSRPGGSEVLSQQGEHGIRVRAVPVVEPVDAGGQPLGEGLEDHSGDAGRERGARGGVRAERGRAAPPGR